VDIIDSYSADSNQKIMVALAGGATLDVFCSQHVGEVASFIDQGQLENLHPFISRFNTDTSGIADLFPSIEKDGKLFTLPYRKSVYVMYYCKNLFDQVNLPYPDPLKPITWDEYTQLAQKLTTGSGDSKTWGILNYAPTNAWWRTSANAVGANNPAVPAQLAEYKKSAKATYDWSYTYKVQEPYQARTGVDGGDTTANFLTKKYGMMVNGDWQVLFFQNDNRTADAKLRFDLAPVPYYAGQEPYSTGVATAACINVKSKVKDEGYKFISALAGEEGAKFLAGYNMLPAWSSPAVKDIFVKTLNATAGIEHGDVFFTQKVRSQVPPDVRYAPAQRIVTQEMSLYLLQEQDLDKTFDVIAKRIKDEVEQ
jgi:multiple sugar transport system substrate-binding protein